MVECKINDRNGNQGNQCKAFSGMFLCTRPKGYTGKHHAHDPDGFCYEIWD